jgi:eukaryotic-like serine/threonine-protein kinase
MSERTHPDVSRMPFDDATWSKVGELLDAALAIADAGERSAFIDRSCGGDTMLRDEVLSLLAADQQADVALPATRWLDHLADPSPSTGADPSLMIGQRLGTWRIDALIAVGGMGAVYRGGRADDSFEKTVAIKLLPNIGSAGLRAGAALAARFDAERRILASLDHPGIARLIDGGTSGDGVPWLVMEYVDGVPVDRYCDEQAPALADRLNLFAGICDAVQFAHQHLVVHRDLKPGNIIVTADGASKLLDFGIAAMLDADADSSTARTADKLLAMTPLWASPEQRLGAAVTTASDVYSLGVLLYRLLTGRMPDANRSGNVRALPDDLDAIVRLAMQQKPQDRYATVAQLAEDVRRFLRREPVSARAGSLAYRVSRFVQRHRVPVALAGFGLTGILLAGATALYQANVANEARARADAERARVERSLARTRKLANESLFAVYDSLRNVPGTTEARALLAAKVAAVLDEMARETSPETSPDRTALLAEAGQSWSRLAIIQSQTAAASSGELIRADTSFRRAIEALAQAFIAEPTNAATALELVRSLRLHGVYLATNNRVAEAPLWLQRAVTIADAFLAATPETRRLRMEASAAASSLAFYARPTTASERAGRRTLALKTRDALEQLASETLNEKERSELDGYRIYLYGTLARAAHTRDDGDTDWRGVLTWTQQALAISKARAAALPGSAHFADQLATSHLDVSAAATELNQHELAAQHAAYALAVREKLFEADRANPGRLSTFVYALAALAESQAKLTDDSAARATLARAQTFLQQLKPELRDQLDMITSEMGINAVAARLDGRAAAKASTAASRAALCRSAENALQRVRKQQPRWEAFHQQSLTPEIDDIRRDLTACER